MKSIITILVILSSLTSFAAQSHQQIESEIKSGLQVQLKAQDPDLITRYPDQIPMENFSAYWADIQCNELRTQCKLPIFVNIQSSGLRTIATLTLRSQGEYAVSFLDEITIE